MTEANDILEHFGVKGMRWGARRAAKKEHETWKKETANASTGTAVWNAAAKSYEPVIQKLNNSLQFKGKDLSIGANSKVAKQYDAIITRGFNQHLVKASVNKTYNAKTDRAMIYQFNRNTGIMSAVETKVDTKTYASVQRDIKKDAAHAAIDEVKPPKFKARFDVKGFILGFDVIEENVVEQSFDNASYFLEHFGVKGMRWGTRSKRTPRKTKLSADHKKRVETGRNRTPVLTNKQIKTFNERANLEMNYNRLNPTKIEKGHKSAKNILKAVGVTTAGVAANSVGQKVGKAFIQKGAEALYDKAKWQ